MQRLQPWHDPAINPLFDSSPALWDPFDGGSAAQETDTDFTSDNNEAQLQDLRGVVRRASSGLSWVAALQHGEAGSAQEKHDLTQAPVARPSRSLAGRKGCHTRSSSCHSQGCGDLTAPHKAAHACQRLQRQRSGGRNRQSRNSVTDAKRQESDRNLRSREQYGLSGPPVATNLSSHSFSKVSVEEVVHEEICVLQNREDPRESIANLHTSYTPSPKLHNHAHFRQNRSMWSMHERNKGRKKLEVEVPGKAASRGRKETKQQVGKSAADLLPRKALSCASKEEDDEDFRSFTLENPGCGMPWDCSRISKDRKKKLTEGTGKNLVCRLPVLSRKQGGKSSSDRKNESSPVKWLSERSSESETTPLLTDHECYHGNSVGGVTFPVDTHIISPQAIAQKFEVNELKECQYDRKATHELNTDNGSYPKPTIGLKCRGSIMDGGNQRTLSQKYSPKSFKDLLGQTMVVQSLSNAVLKGRIAPVYLFQGPCGTGKTSTARVFAAALNCSSHDVPKPCSMCSSCISFNSEKYSDVTEVDAAGNNSIESVQALLTHAISPSSKFHHKVYIIDECHMLTMEAWNTLLKFLEEPPLYVVFILITTNPEELPRTALSRCQRFVFHKIKESEIMIRMQKLSLVENISIDLDALQLIATKSEGSLRDAEMILDQLSLLGERVTLQMVQDLVGLIPDEKLMDLLELSLSGDTVSTVRSIKMLTESGVEPLALLSQLSTLIIDVLGGRDTKHTGLLSECILNKNDLERLRRALKILSKTEKYLKARKDPTTWLAAALLQFAPMSDCYTLSSYMDSSAEESPTASMGTCDKETVQTVNPTARQWWEEEKQSGQLQMVPIAFSVTENQGGAVEDVKRLPSCLQCYLSNCSSIRDNRVYPCEQLPTSAANVEDGKLDNLSQTVAMLDYCNNVSNICMRKNGPMSLSEMDAVWRRVLESYCSNGLKELLGSQAKLVSLSTSEAFAVADLEFQHPEDKLKAERVRRVLSNAFKVVLGCPVEISLSLAALQGSAKDDSWSIPAILNKSASNLKQSEIQTSNSGRLNDPDLQLGLPKEHHDWKVDGFLDGSNKPGNGESVNLENIPAILNRSASDLKQCEIQPSNSEGRPNGPDLQLGLPKEHKDLQLDGFFNHANKPVPGESATLKNHESRVFPVKDIHSWSNRDSMVEPGTRDREQHLASPRRRDVGIMNAQFVNGLAVHRPDVGTQRMVKDRALQNGPIIPVANNMSLSVVLQQADGSVDGYSQDLVYDYPDGSTKGNLKNDAGFSKSVERSEINNCPKSTTASKLPHAGSLCWKIDGQADRKLKQQNPSKRRKARFILRFVPCTDTEL